MEWLDFTPQNLSPQKDVRFENFRGQNDVKLGLIGCNRGNLGSMEGSVGFYPPPPHLNKLPSKNTSVNKAVKKWYIRYSESCLI